MLFDDLAILDPDDRFDRQVYWQSCGRDPEEFSLVGRVDGKACLRRERPLPG